MAVVLVGDDSASEIYVATKQKQAVVAGMTSYECRLPLSATHVELIVGDRLGLPEKMRAVKVNVTVPPSETLPIAASISPRSSVSIARLFSIEWSSS